MLTEALRTGNPSEDLVVLKNQVCTEYEQAVSANLQWTNKQIVKERIEGGANEKAAPAFPVTALSFASISIFPG